MASDLTLDEMIDELWDWLYEPEPRREDGWIHPSKIAAAKGVTPEHVARMFKRMEDEGKAESCMYKRMRYYRRIG